MDEYGVPIRKVLLRWTLVLAVLIIAVYVGLTIWMEVEPPDEAVSRGEPLFVIDHGQVLNDRPVVVRNSRGDFSVYVPCCALGVGGTVILVEEDSGWAVDPERLADWDHIRFYEVRYINRDGDIVSNAFSATPLVVCFKLNEGDWQTYLNTPTEMQIQYYDDLIRPFDWQGLPSYADETGQSICAETNYVRVFALAVRATRTPQPGTN